MLLSITITSNKQSNCHKPLHNNSTIKPIKSYKEEFYTGLEEYLEERLFSKRLFYLSIVSNLYSISVHDRDIN